jgi:hypothetical protein
MDKSFSGTLIVNKPSNVNKTINLTYGKKTCDTIHQIKIDRRKIVYYVPSQFPKIV